MGLLTAFNKYTAYFHDGEIIDIYQTHSEIIFWMESAQIPPKDMVDDFSLTNSSTLRGRLHLEGVKCIYENDVIISEIQKQYDVGDVYHFEITDNVVLIDITWQTLRLKPSKDTDMIDYKIEANEIYWENLPKIKNPTRKTVDEYQKYFINGKIFRVEPEMDRGRIIIIIESTPVPEENSNFYQLTNNNTLKRELILTWPMSIRVNECECNTLERIIGKGEILNFHIGFHFVKLDVHWLNVTSGFPGTSPNMSIEVKCGAISWRNLTDN